MTQPSFDRRAPRSPTSRAAFATAGILPWMLRVGSAVSAGLVGLGLLLRVFGVDRTAWVLSLGLILLVAMPVLRLVAVIDDLARRRQWPFVLAGIAVLGLLAMLLWRTV